jgi:hypothetical protein
MVILRGGKDGATLLSLHLNVSSSLEDNDASSFARPSLDLHTSLRSLEMPKFFFGKIWRKSVTFFQSIGAKKSKIVVKITSKLEVLKRDGAKIVLAENNH